MVFSRVALGLCQGFHYPSLGSLMSHRVVLEERSFTWSVVSSGSHAGVLLCGSLGSILADNFGWRVPFLVSGVAALCWTVLVRTVVLRRRQRVISFNFAASHGSLAEQKMELKHSSSAFRSQNSIPWGMILRQPAFWAMIIGHYAHTNAAFILLSWLPTYFHDNFPDARSWVFNIVPWLLTIPCSVISGQLADWLLQHGFSVTFVRKLMASVTLLGAAIFLLLISYVHSYAGALVCMALALVCNCFHNSGIIINPQDLAPNFGGAIFGLMNMVGAVPGFVGVYIAGYILETTKSWVSVFNQTAGICIIGWFVFVLLGTGRRLV